MRFGVFPFFFSKRLMTMKAGGIHECNRRDHAMFIADYVRRLSPGKKSSPKSNGRNGKESAGMDGWQSASVGELGPPDFGGVGVDDRRRSGVLGKPL
jgi:hypothetical protein